MRISWLIPLAALALASCQAREPQAPGRPGSQADAPPAATAPVPPPSLEPAPRTAAGPACPPARVQACPPAAKASARTRRARTERHVREAAAPQRAVHRRERGGYERTRVDIPPHGGYRYEELEDREIERRYAQRRYDAERYGRRESYREDEQAYGPSRRTPPPPSYDERAYEENYRGQDRYSGRQARSGAYEREESYVERRPYNEEVREYRESRTDGGVRRYEQRSYQEGGSYRETYRESGGYVAGGGELCCARPAAAAGRDANGFLTWPGKVPAIP